MKLDAGMICLILFIILLCIGIAVGTVSELIAIDSYVNIGNNT